MSFSTSRGHGKVFPRPDGFIARCAGPGLCTQCNRELAEKAKLDLAGPALSDPTAPLKAEIERLRQGIQAYLDGDYPNPRQHRPGHCPHGISYRQPCEVCIDNHFQKLLESPP